MQHVHILGYLSAKFTISILYGCLTNFEFSNCTCKPIVHFKFSESYALLVLRRQDHQGYRHF